VTRPATRPTNLAAAAASSTRVDLTWSASTDNVDVTAYDVYRDGTLLKSVTGTSTSDTTVAPSTAYTYTVKARDAAGNVSDPSNTATVTTPATPGGSQTFVFAAAADATIDQANPTTNLGANTRLITDNTPVNDFLLRFNVVAPSCQSITSATLRLTNADGSPKGGDFYTTDSGWNEGTVNWNTAPARGTLVTSLAAVTAGTTYTVDVTSGVTMSNGDVSFRVGSTSSDGARYYSDESSTASQKPQLSVTCAVDSNDTTAPTAPRNLTATAPNSGQVDLSWSASSDNVGVTGYRVFRGSTLLSTVGGSVLTYQDVTVSPSTTYNYTVTAVDGANNESPTSNVATVTTPASSDTQAPTAPTDLTATAASATQVDLAWTASTDNVGVTAYDVYRDGSLLKSVTGTSTSDTTVAASTTYSYVVRARDAAGNTSDPSNTAPATTPSSSGSQTLAFQAAADATIDQANPTANLGTNTRLVTDNSPVNDFLLKFNVAAPSCQTITSATLRLTNADGSPKGGDFYTTSSGWTEGSVNWSTAPARGTLVTSLAAVTAGTTYTVDVTSGVTTLNGEVSFRVGSTSGDGARYYSKEGGTTAQRPLLTVTCS
jgi:chitodextrinase